MTEEIFMINWLIIKKQMTELNSTTSCEKYQQDKVMIIQVVENDDVNKTLLLLLCVSNISKRLGCANIYDLIDKEIKGKYNVKKMNELTKEQIRKHKIDKSRLIKGSEQFMYVHEVIAIPIIMQNQIIKSRDN